MPSALGPPGVWSQEGGGCSRVPGKVKPVRCFPGRPSTRPAPPSPPLPRFTRASLGRSVAASKKCSPPSFASPLPFGAGFLPPPNFSRPCFAFLLPPPRPSSPGWPLAPPGVLGTVEFPQGAGQDPGGKGRETLAGWAGRAWGGHRGRECEKVVTSAPPRPRWRGGTRATAPPPGESPDLPAGSGPRPFPGLGREGRGAAWNLVEQLRNGPVRHSWIMKS